MSSWPCWPASFREDYDRLVAAGITPASAETLAALREARDCPTTAVPGYGPDSGRPAGWSSTRTATTRASSCARRTSWAAMSLDPVRRSQTCPNFSGRSRGRAAQTTPLYAWHKAHTRQIVPFAGWEMPVWYTGVLDEHNAVRQAAGLFDVSHMGVFEVSGPHAAEFLDSSAANYARWLPRRELLQLPAGPGRPGDR